VEVTTFSTEESEASATAATEVDDSVRRNESDEDLIVDVSVKLLVRVLLIIFIFLGLRRRGVFTNCMFANNKCFFSYTLQASEML